MSRFRLPWRTAATTLIAAAVSLVAVPGLIAGTALTIPPAAAADPAPLADPAGAVILEVDGAISVSNRDGRARFDRSMLAELGRGEITTTTEWTDGRTDFAGVPLQAVLERVGASGTMLTVTALNDYSVEVPLADAAQFGVLLATEMNGRRLSVRDKGPIWVVYPRDDFEELNDVAYNERWVWQVARITVK